MERANFYSKNIRMQNIIIIRLTCFDKKLVFKMNYAYLKLIENHNINSKCAYREYKYK